MRPTLLLCEVEEQCPYQVSNMVLIYRMDYVDYDARLEEALAPAPISMDSRTVDPFNNPSGIMATLIRRFRDEGFILPAAFHAYRHNDHVQTMKPAAYRLFGNIRGAWEHMQMIRMSGCGEEEPLVEDMIDSFWQLTVLLASISPYLSDEDAKAFIHKPLQFTTWALSAVREKSNLALRLVVIGLDTNILTHRNAAMILPNMSWSQKIVLYTAMGEQGTAGQSNYDYGAATRVALVLAHR